MRPVSPFHLSHPDVRAIRIALAAGAVAGLAVLGACTDKNDSAITSPPTGLRNSTIEAAPGVYTNAKNVVVCVSGTSANGTYKFTNKNFRRVAFQTGGTGSSSENNPDWNSVWAASTLFKVAAIPPALGNRTADAVIDPTGDIQEITTQGTSGAAAPAWNAATSGTTNDGSAVWTNRGPAEYEVAKGTCLTVLNRGVADLKYCSTGAGAGGAGGPEPACGQDDAVNVDSFTGVTITATTSPGSYNHTDCEVDDGVKKTKNASGVDNANPGNPCNTNNNPTTAFMNIAHGTKLTFFFNNPPVVAACTLGYPYVTAGNSRTNADFNESEVLTGFALNSLSGQLQLHAWYTDEHALTLGADSIFINNKAPKPDSAFGINTLPANPDGNSYLLETMLGHMTGTTTAGVTGNPLKVGRIGTTTIPVGQGNAVDPTGRPLFPALYLTDITGLTDNLLDPVARAAMRAGDWQYASGIGTPKIPNALYGTWKGVIITINKTGATPTTTLKGRDDPAKNHKVVGGVGQNPPALAADFGYSSDIVWNVSALGLIPNHDYRAQVIVHDGDQNKDGGDTGQACVHIIQSQ